MRTSFQVLRHRISLLAVGVLASSIAMSSMAFASDPDSQLNDLRMTPTVRAIQRVSPAVVNIHGQKTVRSTAAGMAGAEGPDSFRQVNGMGTGVVIDPRGYVVTNFHVVEDVDDIRVTLSNGETTSAQLVASRVKSDLALIKVDSSSLLPTIPRGTSSDLMVGEPVIAIGNAFGYVHTSTQGIVSALHRDVPVNETQEYRDLIQISAGINPGNSGGPLLNIKGEMIGVNVAVRVGAQQIAFAIPIDQVVEIVTEMIEIHNEQRLLTGVRATGGPRDGDGITIANVSASSPAARDGLKPGDRVIRVGSQPVDDRLDFALAMLEVEPGRAMEFEVERSGKRFDLAVVGEAPQSASPQSVAAAAWTMLGIQAKPVAESTMRRLNARMRTKYTGGLYIQAVRPGSAADQQGIVPGDVLLGIHGFETTTMAGLGSILELPEIKRGPKARFYLVRREQTLYGHMQIAAMPSSTHR
ncbi:putative periplasmic serine endoprotease DegP-like precursor [Rubripirellula amarantea]|uniref:Putative periplasmic serine endoprotease DegP-like n=2 Tax=Rubripirellula amarantea TaxID=2527999 RepID=A0A5C5WSM9_9BACT|nr:putative periplasmic serine endoprotease DegP-like precursor [Rubripirellula amarantea]